MGPFRNGSGKNRTRRSDMRREQRPVESRTSGKEKADGADSRTEVNRPEIGAAFPVCLYRADRKKQQRHIREDCRMGRERRDLFALYP